MRRLYGFGATGPTREEYYQQIQRDRQRPRTPGQYTPPTTSQPTPEPERQAQPLDDDYAARVEQATEYDPTKEYFEVSIYRNILDMLNSYEGALKAVANWVRNDFNDIAANTGGRPRSVVIEGGAFSYVNNELPGAHVKDFYFNPSAFWRWVNELLNDAGVSGTRWRDTRLPETSPYDLLSLARSLEWEMNRVRLPLPNNFRQLSALVEGRVYDDLEIRRSGPESTPDIGIYGDHGFVSRVELLQALPQLQAEVKKMRTAVRKEIDAAQLAKQVEEETLRQEREELKSNEQVEAESRARAREILEQKEREYLADYDKLLDLYADTEQMQAEVEAALQDLEAEIAAATDAQALNALRAEAEALSEELQDLETRRKNIVTQLDTLQAAIANIDTEREDLLAAIYSDEAAEIRASIGRIREFESELRESQQAIIDRLNALGEPTPGLPENDAIEAENLQRQLERDEQAREIAEQMLALKQQLLELNQQLQSGDNAEAAAEKAAVQAELDKLKKQAQSLDAKNVKPQGTGVGAVVILGLLASLAT